MRRFALVLSLACASLKAQTVTFSQQVAPILYKFCAPCHRPGEAAPFSLLSFEDAKKHATQIARVTKQRYMPPWPPAAGHGDFAGARRLSEEQIEVLSKWAASGMAEGNSARSAAAILGVSTKTVEAHKFNFMRKLGLHNRAQVINYALRKGLIRMPTED